MRVLIIDDERLARKELTTLLKQYVHLDIIGESATADDAAKKIEKLRPDLIFLDIHMPEKNGFDLLEELIYVPDVIFVTAYDEFAIKAFEVNALDYLLKPVDPIRLESTLKRMQIEEVEDEEVQLTAKKRLSENDQIFLKDGEKCWFVDLKDVRVFESEGNYVRVFFKDSKPLILKSLNTLEARLDPKLFFRANRKFIINLKWIDSIENWFNGGLLAKMKDGNKVEISRRQASKFKDLMSL